MSIDALPVLPPVFEPGSPESKPQTVEYSLEQVGQALFGKDGLSFHDLLAAINPLQHIPVIGNIYRALTGDTLSAGARMAGGALYGGPIGLMAGAINAAIEGSTGKDVGAHMMALVSDPDQPPATALADAGSPTQSSSFVVADNPSDDGLPRRPTLATADQAEAGPRVSANPVRPVASAPAAAAADGLTPESYARAIAAANGHLAPQLPVRPGAAPELSNEDFARLLAGFGKADTASLAGGQAVDSAAVAATPVAYPAPAGFAPPTRQVPLAIRIPGRGAGSFAR